MNKLFFFFFLCTGMVCSAQTNKLLFQYDTAGNQISRKLCVNCQIADKNSSNESMPKYEQFFEGDVISYYPNPLKEELNLKWERIDDKNLSKIQLFSLSGQLLKTIDNIGDSKSYILSFTNYPSGVYLIVLNYTDENIKTIKIVKE
jgi:Secretion system C-terminal sorting domain